MRVVVLVALFVVSTFQLSSSPQQLRTLFREKIAEYRELGVVPDNGIWSKSGEKRHFKAFSKFAEMVQKHNEGPGEKSWIAVLNQFSLMTSSERESYLGVKNTTFEHRLIQKRDYLMGNDYLMKRSEELPVDVGTVDWSHKLPPAKNQGSCGSCWIFGAVAPIEYQINKDKKDITSLSEQHFSDCVYKSGSCGGGWPIDCWNWLVLNNINPASEASYPYTAKSGTCRKDTVSAMGDYKTFGWWYIAGNNEGMRQGVANPKYGVVSALIQVQGGFQSYGGGIYKENGCYGFNHAVDVVGYGIESNGEQWWKVRNSWGSWWGENGYIRMHRGPGVNTCSVVTYGKVPYVATDAERKTWFNNNEIGKECIGSGDTHGFFYRGKANRTKSGLLCQNWLSQTPNAHNELPDNQDYFNRGLGDHNYCRSPDDKSQPWCYNGQGTNPAWEHCNVKFC